MDYCSSPAMSILSSSHGIPLLPTNEQQDNVDGATKKRDFEATEDKKLESLDCLPNYASNLENHGGGAPGSVPLAGSAVELPDSEQVPPKRRKTTTAEKEAAQREQEERARRRAEEKAKQEQEKQRKQAEKLERELAKQRKEAEREEERRKKAAEREEKRRQTEEEKRIKDEAKRKKDEEREKKEKGQLRLNAFFVRTQTSTNDQPLSTSTNNDMLEGDQAGSDAIILPKPSQDSDSLYRHDFRPFFVKPSVSLAPWNRFITTKDIESICKAIDACLESPKGLELEEGVNKALHLRNLCSSRPRSAQRLRQRTLPGVKDIVLRIQGTVNNPVDLTHESDSASLLADPLKALMSVPIKVLQYHEDVRPPYRGTFTRLPPRGSALRLGKNPFERSLPDIDYDYDSEAEWEDIAPGDGEDLDSESDDDGGAADDDGEDMEGFLDDTEEDDAVRAKRLLIKDEMEPYCSGLWWENVQAEPQHDGDPGPGPTFQPMQYRMELLDLTAQLPIDPCPAGFWSVSAPKSAGSNGPVHSMGPPRYGKEDQAHARPPLSQIPFAHSNGGAADAAPSSSRGPRRSQRALTPEELEIFKSTVQGSSHTKGTLVEVLKKQLPKVPKEVIKDLLSTTAARVGLKEADKRWQIIQATS